MPKNQSPHTVSHKVLVALRRRQVASLRLRGYTEREIADELANEGMLNPRTGMPWTQQTMNNDLKAIREDWRKRAAEDIAEHIARILAELSEVKRSAWAEKDYQAILRAIEKEAKILGVDSPDKQIVIEGDLETFLSRLPEEYQIAIRNLILTDFVGGGPARLRP